MPTIYKRGTKWYLNWHEGGERYRYSLGQVSKREAEIALQTKELELATGKQFLAGNERVHDFLDTYLDWHEAEYPDSHERVRQILTKIFSEFHDYALDGLSTYDIELWKGDRLKQVSKGTVLKELRTLSAMYNRAVTWNHLANNPVKAVAKPRDKTTKPPRWYTKTELDALYAASGHKQHWWRLMVNTGIRAGEARHLRWDDIKREHLHVLSDTHRTKSGEWRQIPLSKGASDALSSLRRAERGAEYVLPPMHPKSLSRAFKSDQRRAGIGGYLHCLRHTFASTLVQAGRPLREVQELLGHASITTTERYAYLTPENLEAAVRDLDL